MRRSRSRLPGKLFFKNKGIFFTLDGFLSKFLLIVADLCDINTGF